MIRPWPNFAALKICKTKFCPVEMRCELYSKLTQVRLAEASVSDIKQVRFILGKRDFKKYLRILFPVCNNHLRGYRGVIESPNFPDDYPHNANCSWIVHAPPGNKINVSFSHFALENIDSGCSVDYIRVKIYQICLNKS
jgi:CUB domain